MSEQDTITKEMFASLVLNLLSEAGESDWAVSYSNFSVASNNGEGPQFMSLARMYHEYLTLESPDNFLTLNKQINLLLNARHSNREMDTKLASLLPCVRTLSSFQQANITFRKQPSYSAEKEIIFFPYAEVLAMGLVFDDPETMKHLRFIDVEELGLEVEDAIDIAVGNLRAISAGPMRVVQPGFYTSPWKDFYDGSRLMLPELFEELDVAGDVVALSPAPDALFVTGSKDLIGLELMSALGQSLMRHPRSVWCMPLVLKDGVWQAFVVQPDDAAFDTINTYRMNVLNSLYQSQEGMLEDVAKDTGAFIAPFVIETDANRDYLFSKTNVIEEKICIIPEADVIEFFTREHGGIRDCVGRAPFETVSQILGDKLVPDTAFRPKRWHMSQFPSSDDLRAIGTMPPHQSPLQSTTVADLTVLTRLFSLPVPEGTRIDSALRSNNDNNELSIDFVISCTPVDLSAFYLKRLPIGSYMMIGTEQGDFHVAELIGAGCKREIWFGPSRKRGETLLRWVKRLNLDTPSVLTALTKQTDELYSLEQIFEMSIINDSIPQGDLRITEKNVRQNFITSHSPEAVTEFFRCQMSAMKTVYMQPEQGSPHLILDPTLGISVTVKSSQSPQGTQYWLSKDVQKAK